MLLKRIHFPESLERFYKFIHSLFTSFFRVKWTYGYNEVMKLVIVFDKSTNSISGKFRHIHYV